MFTKKLTNIIKDEINSINLWKKYWINRWKKSRWKIFSVVLMLCKNSFSKKSKEKKSDKNLELKNERNENVKKNRNFKIRLKILCCRDFENDCFFNRETCQNFIKQWNRNMYNDVRNLESMWFRYEKRFEISRHQCHREQSFFRKNVRKRENLFRKNYRANFHFCYQEWKSWFDFRNSLRKKNHVFVEIFYRWLLRNHHSFEM